MQIKKIRRVKISSISFAVRWQTEHDGAEFYLAGGQRGNYIELPDPKQFATETVFECIVHEINEICAHLLSIRYERPDCDSDYLFCYDHKQHTSFCAMSSAAISEFIK